MTHWVEFQLPRDVVVRSVALFLKHDATVDGYQLRRAARQIRFAVRDGKEWRTLFSFERVIAIDGFDNQDCAPMRELRARGL